MEKTKRSPYTWNNFIRAFSYELMESPSSGVCDPVRFAVGTIAHAPPETTSLDRSHEHLLAVADIPQLIQGHGGGL